MAQLPIVMCFDWIYLMYSTDGVFMDYDRKPHHYKAFCSKI